jgi:hypothetical protein
MDFWADFWNIIWLFFWAYVFFAYLIALVSIITDIFRDHELNGWFKALWIIFLVWLPFITALVYLIARGRGMAERYRERAQESKTATEDYIRSVARSSPSDEIAKAKKLLDDGTITPEEFASIKQRAVVS